MQNNQKIIKNWKNIEKHEKYQTHETTSKISEIMKNMKNNKNIKKYWKYNSRGREGGEGENPRLATWTWTTEHTQNPYNGGLARLLLYYYSASSTTSREVQTALFFDWLFKTKMVVVVSLNNFLCVLISRSLSNLKEKYTPPFRQKRIHICIT